MNDTTSQINDGGARMSYGDGKAIREPSTGKGRFDLVTPFGWMRLAKWYELGAHKYSDRNWEKGMPFSRYIDSALRHICRQEHHYGVCDYAVSKPRHRLHRQRYPSSILQPVP